MMRHQVAIFDTDSRIHVCVATVSTAQRPSFILLNLELLPELVASNDRHSIQSKIDEPPA